MNYEKTARLKLEQLQKKKDRIILAIESSCDETAVCITEGNKILSNKIASQIDIHKVYGGVVPEIASRNHVKDIQRLFDEALMEADIDKAKIDAIAVTYGSGLKGSLLVGVMFAKMVAYVLNIPLIPVNHIRAHIAVNYFLNDEIKFPYVGLIVSGGHTALTLAETKTDFKILGQTQDDACGEAFDKVARVLNLEYPGGPNIERLAKSGKDNIVFPIPLEDELDFSFSGLKTAVINYVHQREMKKESFSKADVAASFQKTAVDSIIIKLLKLVQKFTPKSVVLSGGVASNGYLRERIKEELDKYAVDTFYPPLKYCTDNALMVAAEANYLIDDSKAVAADLFLDVDADLDINIIYSQENI